MREEGGTHRVLAPRVQFRFEAFNIANHPNFDDPGLLLTSNTVVGGRAVPGTGPFGQISSTRPNIPMRQLQMGLKLVF